MTLCAAIAPAPAIAQGLIVLGISIEGGGGNAYEKIIDLGSGKERTTDIQGLSSSQHGYDGELWNYFNGVGATIDMPSQIEDSRAEMWIGRSAWRLLGKPNETRRKVALPHASPIELRFDPATRRVSTATFEGDYAPITISFSDWRPIGRFVYPFRQEWSGQLDGAKVQTAQSVRVVQKVDPNLLARPTGPTSTHLAAGAVTVPFKSVGRLKTHTLVSASINGTPAEFIFDTGAANILTIDAAKRFRIAAAGGVSVGGVGEGADNGGFGIVDRVSIGPASLDDQSFIIIPSPFPPTNGKPSDTAGLLGYEFLANFVTTIDYRTETMTFRNEVPADQKGVRFPFVSDGHAIAIMGNINGRPGMVRFDTGDGGTLTLFPAYTASAGLNPGTAAVQSTGSGAGGESRSRPGSLDRFSLAGVNFMNLPVQFSTMRRGAFASRHLAGNLGAAVIRCFRVTFDYRHHQLWLEPQLDTPQCAAAPTTSR